MESTGLKKNSPAEPALERGIAVLAMDGPGVGESPLKGSEDAERVFGAVFDWAATQKTFDPNKIGAWGYSTGGYWAVKVAYVYKDKIACAVSQGGLCTTLLSLIGFGSRNEASILSSSSKP